MNTATVKFNMKDRPEFFKELRKRVNQYFKENNLSKHANFNMKLKTTFMLALYFVPMALMLAGVFSSFWVFLLLWAIMGLGMSGIGMSIMHDANHGSYSKNKKVNQGLGWLIHFIGGYRENWKIQHNVLHHSYTNIEGMDEDIGPGLIRMTPHQKRRWAHRFQMYYATFLYGLMTVFWSIAKDFQQVIVYNQKDLLKGQGLTFKNAMLQIILNKIWYFVLLIVVPILILDVSWWQVVVGYLVMHYICGLVLSLVFQAAHVLRETNFYVAEEDISIEDSWAIHQFRTTANFANGSTFFSWFVGGLNFQIEHHLFPNICHVHYRKISAIVKETAKEFSVPYLQHKTFLTALRSHYSQLNHLGTGKI